MLNHICFADFDPVFMNIKAVMPVHIFLFSVHIFQDIMVTVFENGKLLKDYSFSEVRENAEIDLVKKKSPAN